MAGDRGMITSARIAELRKLDGMAWITCLRGPAIKKLMADGGPLQLSLFDEQDLAEISTPDYPGERLIACRNPVLAAERARKREDLLAATEAGLATIAARVAVGRIKDPDKIGVAAGKIINKRKVAKHFPLDIAPGQLAWRRCQPAIDAEAATDGIYVIRNPSPKTPSAPPPRSPPTRTWPASNATSDTSKPTTWTCGPRWRHARRPQRTTRHGCTVAAKRSSFPVRVSFHTRWKAPALAVMPW